MNQFFAAGALVVITVMLWGIGKKPKTLLDKGISTVISINTPSLVQSIDPTLRPAGLNNSVKRSFNAPLTRREKFELRRHLKQLIISVPDQRLNAIEIAGEWGDRSVIPILRLGLRDMDRRVVIQAAKAIAKFKNKSITPNKKKAISHPPNVFLMR